MAVIRMSNRVSLSGRDHSLLRLLSWTPATTALLVRASVSFGGEPFSDERRLRERLQALAAAGFVRAWPSASVGGGLQNYYKLTAAGFGLMYGPDVPPPGRAYFAEISPTFFDHTFRPAEIIVEVVRACHQRRVTIERFIRENELVFQADGGEVRPDCFFRLHASGRDFNVAFEIDRSTEPLRSDAATALRRKLTVYHEYQERVLAEWRQGGKAWHRPRFRCVFTTRSMERLHHILALAAETNRRPSRRVVVGAPHDALVTAADPLFEPILLDHFGGWQALVDLAPTATFLRQPVRIQAPLAAPLGV